MRTEFITAGNCEPLGELAPGVVARVFVSGDRGARGLTTGTATLRPGALMPYHTHPTGEAITAVAGEAEVLVEGRRYRLRPFDSIYVPSPLAHAVRNASGQPAVLHTAFPTPQPVRDFVDRDFPEINGGDGGGGGEHLMRFESAPRYRVGDATEACDLFAGRFGAQGMCGGYARFDAGAELPCHVHDYDESITIVSGSAVCRVAGKAYELSDLDTACVPQDRPHRFLNRGRAPMEMIWVYAGDEPARRLVEASLCDAS